VVYPEEADAAKGRVSVLSPIGNALLGMKVGQVTNLRLPRGGERALRVLRILYQPEAEGHLTT
jgi:regulator of nucleoside diphosphate kinase